MKKKEKSLHAPKSRKSLVWVPRHLNRQLVSLRIPESSNILDNTGVHPENYAAVKELFKRLDIKDLTEEAQTKLKSVSITEMAQELDLGQETLKDIIADLLKPGRDFRDSFDAPVLAKMS